MFSGRKFAFGGVKEVYWVVMIVVSFALPPT